MRNHFSRKEFRIYLSILGSILGSALGFLTLRAIQYFQNLLLQPRLAPKPLPEILQDQTNLEERAIEIANQNLHAGIEPRLLDVELTESTAMATRPSLSRRPRLSSD